MNILKTEKELKLLINEFPEKSIWKQKVPAKTAWNLLISSFICIVLFFLYYFFAILKLSPADILHLDRMTLLITTLLFVISVFTLHYLYNNTSIASSMVYSIFPKHISFEWGNLKKKKVEIPFEDITAINLVDYDDKQHSTIFFGTKKRYELKKIEFDTAEDRFHITFENILQGKKVHELLTKLQNMAKAN